MRGASSSRCSAARRRWPLAARGQAARKRPLVGWLGGGSQNNQVATRNRDAFVQGLREHGYEDGKNVDIVYRWADGDISRFPELATELVALDPAVIVSAANTGTIALRQVTSIVPIVSALLVDPIAFGLAENHNRPGRNVTDSCKRSTACPESKQSCWWSLCRRRPKSVCW